MHPSVTRALITSIVVRSLVVSSSLLSTREPRQPRPKSCSLLQPPFPFRTPSNPPQTHLSPFKTIQHPSPPFQPLEALFKGRFRIPSKPPLTPTLPSLQNPSNQFLKPFNSSKTPFEVPFRRPFHKPPYKNPFNALLPSTTSKPPSKTPHQKHPSKLPSKSTLLQSCPSTPPSPAQAVPSTSRIRTCCETVWQHAASTKSASRQLLPMPLALSLATLVVTLSVFSAGSKVDTPSLWWQFHRHLLRRVRGRLLDFNV